MAEFPDLGQHCSVCNNIDFLPIQCHYCKEFFCKDHHSLVSHNCPFKDNAPEIVNENRSLPSQTLLEKCSFCNSSVPHLELVECNNCHNKHCLSHRHADDHKCTVKPNPNVKPVSSAIKISSESPAIKGSKNESLARKVAVMKLKQNAKGMSSVPMNERIYFNILYLNESKPMFLSKEWSIGKSIDWIASQLNITNNNNNPNAAKLVLSHRDDTEPFSFNSKLIDLVNDNKLCDGDDLIIKYIE